MSWIIEAQQEGLKVAQDIEESRRIAAEDKAALEAEPKPTEKKVAQFLKKYHSPVFKIIDDLKKAGYTVETEGPQFLFDRELKGEFNRQSEKFSLSKVRGMSVGSHGYGTAYYRQVYGQYWEIKSGDREIGNIRTYAMSGIRTHLNKVDYLVGSRTSQEAKVVANSEQEQEEIVLALKSAVRELIKQEAISPTR